MARLVKQYMKNTPAHPRVSTKEHAKKRYRCLHFILLHLDRTQSA